MEMKDLVKLAKIVANANASSQVAYSFGDEQFSYTDANEALRKELNELAGTYSLYRENQNKIFSLIEQVIDDVLPRKVMEQYAQFAEIKTFNQGDKPVFTQKTTAVSKRRAKRFITKVGLAGIYEVFKLDGKSIEVPTEAFGGAAQIGLEEFLDGRVDFAEILDIVMEGLDEKIYEEIASSLKASANKLPAERKTSQSNFVETAMDNLLSVADSYGKATIYCTYEFAATMVPATGWISDNMRDQKWANGYLGNYKGHNVVVLAQSYTDETNKTKALNPGYAYIIPTGTDKPVKIAFEGQTIVDEFKNYDRSREVQVYKKLGVATVVSNGICVYINSTLDNGR